MIFLASVIPIRFVVVVIPGGVSNFYLARVIMFFHIIYVVIIPRTANGTTSISTSRLAIMNEFGFSSKSVVFNYVIDVVPYFLFVYSVFVFIQRVIYFTLFFNLF